jgi:hypothetical protein
MKTRMCLTGFPLWQRQKECLKSVHTFPRQNTHVQMKALTPSPMKLADHIEEVLLRQTRQRPKGPEREAYLGQVGVCDETLRGSRE